MIEVNSPTRRGKDMSSVVYTVRYYGKLADGPNAGRVLAGHVREFFDLEEARVKAQADLPHLEPGGYATLSQRDGSKEGPSGDVVLAVFGPAPEGLVGRLALTRQEPTEANKNRRWIIQLRQGLYLGQRGPVATKAA